MTTGSDEPTAQAQAIMERVLRLVTDCRSVLRALEHPIQPGESSSAEAERILYFTLMSAIDAGAHQDDGGCAPGAAPREPAVGTPAFIELRGIVLTERPEMRDCRLVW